MPELERLYLKLRELDSNGRTRTRLAEAQ